MNIAASAAGLVAVALSSALGGPSLSSALFAPESRWTDLSSGTCSRERDGFAVREDEFVQFRCPGAGGARVLLAVGEGRTGLGFAWSSRETAGDVLASDRIEPRLEWRGIRTARGFEPYAALVRVSVGRDGAAREAVAVLRVAQGRACVMDVVDVAHTQDADATARLLADRRARSHRCGSSARGPDGTS